LICITEQSFAPLKCEQAFSQMVC